MSGNVFHTSGPKQNGWHFAKDLFKRNFLNCIWRCSESNDTNIHNNKLETLVFTPPEHLRFHAMTPEQAFWWAQISGRNPTEIYNVLNVSKLEVNYFTCIYLYKCPMPLRYLSSKGPLTKMWAIKPCQSIKCIFYYDTHGSISSICHLNYIIVW